MTGQPPSLPFPSLHALLATVAQSGGVTKRELEALTGNRNTASYLQRLHARELVTRDGTRKFTGKDGHSYTCGVWKVTHTGRQVLAHREQEGSGAQAALARVQGWLGKAARMDVTDTARLTCVLLALDEISAAPQVQAKEAA